MKTLSFTIAGEPFGKQNMRPAMRNGHATSFNPSANVKYMGLVIDHLDRVVEESEELYIFPKGTPLFVTIVAYFQIPKTHYKLRKRTGKTELDKEGQAMLEGKIKPTKKPDLDNISKIICDAITKQGHIWFDDSQIICSLLMKEYSETPRVEVTIEGRE